MIGLIVIQINEMVIICQVTRQVTENALTVMGDVCVLKEKTRKLEHEKCIQYHSTRNRSLKVMLGKPKLRFTLTFSLHL
jgi:hypothetical protein